MLTYYSLLVFHHWSIFQLFKKCSTCFQTTLAYFFLYLKIDKLVFQPILRNLYYTVAAKFHPPNLNYCLGKLWLRVWNNIPCQAFKFIITFSFTVSQKQIVYITGPFSILYRKQEYFSFPKFQKRSTWI